VQARPPAPGAAAEIRARAGLRFGLVDFLKPEMETDAGLDPYLAPLFHRELAGPDDPTHPADLCGRVERDADGLLRVDPSRPAVYFERGTARVAGVKREVLAFLWFHAAELPGELAPQGVRVTLDPDGLPATFEVLRDSTGLDVVYVTRRVEDAARERFGAPLAGRELAVERALDAAPRTVVAGVSETGPMMLGPYLYLGRGATDVLALHCRCEPARSETVRGNVEYALVPVAELDALGVERPAWPAAGIDERLRLPDAGADGAGEPGADSDSARGGAGG
jgi:hypothetical protein